MRMLGGPCRHRKAPMFKKMKRSMTGLLCPWEWKKFRMPGARGVRWEDPGDDMVGEMGRSQMENSVVFWPVCSEEPLKALGREAHNPASHLRRSLWSHVAIGWSCPLPANGK